VLVVDTASRTEALALAHGEWVVSTLSCRTHKGHSAILLPAIDRHLQRLGWSATDLDAVGVVVGPGSFTGIRVGIATMDGLARAAGIPVFGYGSLWVRAQALVATGEVVVPLLDARKGEVYGAAWQGAEALVAPMAAAPEDFAALLDEQLAGRRLLACGGGARLYADRFRERLGELFELAPGAGDAPGVAATALDLVRRVKAGEAPADGELEPRYLRPSQAEQRPHP